MAHTLIVNLSLPLQIKFVAPQVVERRREVHCFPRYLCKTNFPFPKKYIDHSRRPLNGANPVLQSSSSSAGLMGLIIPSSSVPAIGAVPCRDIGLKT